MILLISFICLFLFLFFKKQKIEQAYFTAIIIWVCVCYFLNEILSLVHKLDKTSLNIGYICFTLITVLMTVHEIKKRKIHTNILKKIEITNHKLEIFVIALFALFFIFMIGMSILTVPYNWDSMTYHLSRIAHWTQNKSVAHYASNDIRQITSPVLAEFVNLQVYILNDKNDLFLNLLQSTSYVTNTILIFFLTRKLKVEKRYCYLSSLVFISMPIAFGEALTTQVDHFSTLWLLLFVYFLLDLLDETFRFEMSGKVIEYVLLLGACIGLGYLTKPSIMFAIVGFAVWLLCVTIKRKDKFIVVLELILIAGAEVVFIVIPEIGRNLISFHAISAPIAGARQLVGTLNPLYVMMNGLKNLAMNLPNMYFNELAKIGEYVIHWIAYKLQIELDHHSISEGGREFFLHAPQTYNHDTAVNPIVFILTLIVIIWLIKKLVCREEKTQLDIFSTIAIVVFVVFCMALRWEPYVTRYMLSYLALLCPVVGGQLSCMKSKDVHMGRLIAPIAVFVCVIELVGLVKYHGNICLEHINAESRKEAYFTTRKSDKASYMKLDEIFAKESWENIGVYLETDTYEYPIWKQCGGDVRIEAINVMNDTGRYADTGFVPEAIITINRNPEDIVNYLGERYVPYLKIDELIYISVKE